MSDDPKLRVLYSAEQGMPAWAPEEIMAAHEALAQAIAHGDHIAIVSLRRMRRGARTSVYELLGVLQAAINDWLEDP